MKNDRKVLVPFDDFTIPESVKWICYKFEETVNDEKYPGMMSGQEREV